MTSQPYFHVSNGRFTRDLELGFDYTKVNPILTIDWSTTQWIDCSWWKPNQIIPLDINDIPPSIFLLSIVNSLSTAMHLYIPLDMPYQKFFERLAVEFADGPPKFGGRTLPLVTNLNDQVLDVDDLNATGIIRSAMKWNNYWKNNHGLWLSEGKCLHSIQGVVQSARHFWNEVRKSIIPAHGDKLPQYEQPQRSTIPRVISNEDFPRFLE